MPKTKQMPEEVVIRLERAGTLTIPILGQLKPGVNIVKSSIYQAARDSLGEERWTKLPLSVDLAAPTGTAGRSTNDAKDLVNDTLDVGILEGFLAGEGRDNVRASIHEQIDVLKIEGAEDDNAE